MEAERSARKGERAASKTRMAIAIAGLLGTGSLAIDIGSALVSSSGLQSVADAATRELAMAYKTSHASNPGFDYRDDRLSQTEKPLQVQLARALGINQIAITAESTAAISAMGTLKAGKGEFRVGREKDSFQTHDCSADESVTFSPTRSTSWVGDAGRDSR